MHVGLVCQTILLFVRLFKKSDVISAVKTLPSNYEQ